MNASPEEQRLLLEVQANDIRLTQVARKLATLPQIAALASLVERETALRRQQSEAANVLDERREALARIESDVAVAHSRQLRDRERLDTSSSVKDISALESELTSLAARLSDLEDQQIEAMEELEEAQAADSKLGLTHTELLAERDELEQQKVSSEKELASERDTVIGERAKIAERVPAELLSAYELRRERSGGSGAALLRQRSCSACTITLTGTDLERVRMAAPELVLFCPDCDCILVRTNESGL